jgi:hypothetical protein
MTDVVLTKVWEDPAKVGSGSSGRTAGGGELGTSSCSYRAAIWVLFLVDCPTCFFFFFFILHPPTMFVAYLSHIVPMAVMFILSSSKLLLHSTLYPQCTLSLLLL